MATADTNELRSLSRSASSKVNWQRVTDALGVKSSVMRGEESSTGGGGGIITAEEREQLRRGIAVVRQEFAVTLGAIRNVMRIVMIAVVVALALSVAGGALIQVTPYASLISVASIGSLFALLFKAWQLSRDQAMLELIPARYSMAIEFCHTHEDAQKLIGAFLAETSSLRAGEDSKGS